MNYSLTFSLLYQKVEDDVSFLSLILGTRGCGGVGFQIPILTWVYAMALYFV